VNRKLLEVERLSHHCVLPQDALDCLQQPSVEAGQRVSALRFGDPRVMALLQALCAFTHLPRGFRNRELRPHVAALLGQSYTAAQMTYDLRRLRLKGLIHRIPGTHRYTATTYAGRHAWPGEAPYDITLAIRVDALDGRHPEVRDTADLIRVEQPDFALVSGVVIHPGEAGEAMKRRKPNGAHFALKAQRWRLERMYSVSPTGAGVAKIGSPRSFLARISRVSPDSRTVTMPSDDAV
jgi:hypothetical protein